LAGARAMKGDRFAPHPETAAAVFVAS